MKRCIGLIRWLLYSSCADSIFGQWMIGQKNVSFATARSCIFRDQLKLMNYELWIWIWRRGINDLLTRLKLVCHQVFIRFFSKHFFKLSKDIDFVWSLDSFISHERQTKLHLVFINQCLILAQSIRLWFVCILVESIVLFRICS